MSLESATEHSVPHRLRTHGELVERRRGQRSRDLPHPGGFIAVVLLLGGLFVFWGAASLDLGPLEARLGLAAGESLAPIGQVYGGWEPALWPAHVLSSQLWVWLEGSGTPGTGSVRWPAAIAGVALGLVLALRARRVLRPRAGLMTALCWFSCLALIDRSAGAGIDLIAGLGTIAALDRVLGRGSDLVAGWWTALAVLAGGWPPLAMVALATIVIGRREAALSWRLVLPSLLVGGLWSAWALASAPAAAWAAALTLPLTRSPSWTLALEVLALGLPWSPVAFCAGSRTVRTAWPEAGRRVVVGWLQVSGACLLAGTVIPGLATAARMPAIAGLVVTAAAVAESVWQGALSQRARRGFLGLTLLVLLGWTVLVSVQGIYLVLAVSYYRPIATALVSLALGIGPLALAAVWRGHARVSLALVIAVSICLKVAHWGVYVPEWNYRFSQGPWGRAIGQWVPPRWPIFTLHMWPADLGFYVGHPIRQLVHPRILNFRLNGRPLFVLLHSAEFEHWPSDVPRLIKVREFEDERGGTRVLARTEGNLAASRFNTEPE